jgi:hypothetical protein
METLENEVVIQETTEQTAAPTPTVSETLQGAFWGDATPQAAQQTETAAVREEPKKEEPQQAAATEWWKGFEYDSEETAKSEIQKLKQVKPAEELKFANDQSKIVFDYLKEGKVKEVKDFLDKQERLQKFTSTEVTDETAAEILKASMQFKYQSQNLTQQEIEYKFNKEYGFPKEPQPKDDDLDGEYEARRAAWQEIVNDIKMSRNIDAKLALPELEKLKAELVLPDISQNNQAASKEPTQEELAAFKKQQESFVEATEKFLNNFNGFSANVKDKDVDYTVSYGTSKEEKDLALNMMKEFASKGFNANELFVKDWVNQDGTLNVNKIIEDKMFLQNRERIIQKVANDAANQRLELYLKDKKNIRIDNSGGKDFGTGLEQKTKSEQLQEAFWGGN